MHSQVMRFPRMEIERCRFSCPTHLYITPGKIEAMKTHLSNPARPDTSHSHLTQIHLHTYMQECIDACHIHTPFFCLLCASCFWTYINYTIFCIALLIIWIPCENMILIFLSRKKERKKELKGYFFHYFSEMIIHSNCLVAKVL